MIYKSLEVFRSFLTTSLFAAAVLPAQAQNFPSKPITMVVPFTAGGTTDIIGRIVADGLGKRLGQPVIVDNRGGAGGNIGAAAVAQAKSDGYTLLLGYNGTNAINPSLYKKLSWDPIKSFDPVSMVARVNNVVVVNPSLEIKTLPDLVTYSKAHPGEMNYGSAGAGSIFHLAGEMFQQLTGTRMTHVPYKGAAPALTDLMGGQVDVMFSTIPAALPFIKAGKLRAIAVTGPRRSPLFPDLPTAGEAGYPAMVVDSWFAVFAPKGLPVDIQSMLNTAIREIIVDPAIVKKMEEQGAQPMGSTPVELTERLTKDIRSWNAIVNSAKVTLD